MVPSSSYRTRSAAFSSFSTFCPALSYSSHSPSTQCCTVTRMCSTPAPALTRRQVLASLFLLAAVPVRADDGFVALPCDGAGCRSIEYKDFRVGTGSLVLPDSTVVVKWTGRLADRYGWPFQQEADDYSTFVLSRDRLIPGFVQGIQGMREGGKRRLFIPSQFGYQDEAMGPLPNDYGDRRRLFATVLNKRRFKNGGDLVIDIQLKKVKPV